MRIGQFGFSGKGLLENLSLVGMIMLRTDLPLKVGKAFGSEFVVFESPLIDLTAVVVSRIGDLYGARFQAVLISEWLIQEAIDNALNLGKASVLSINELQGRKVMRIAGGLNAGLRNDFMHSLTKMGVDEMDLSGVTRLTVPASNSAGLPLTSTGWASCGHRPRPCRDGGLNSAAELTACSKRQLRYSATAFFLLQVWLKQGRNRFLLDQRLCRINDLSRFCKCGVSIPDYCRNRSW